MYNFLITTKVYIYTHTLTPCMYVCLCISVCIDLNYPVSLCYLGIYSFTHTKTWVLCAACTISSTDKNIPTSMQEIVPNSLYTRHFSPYVPMIFIYLCYL